jgi:hypothetical protein
MISSGLVEFRRPGVNHGVPVKELHGSPEAALEFLLR